MWHSSKLFDEYSLCNRANSVLSPCVEDAVSIQQLIGWIEQIFVSQVKLNFHWLLKHTNDTLLCFQ